MDTGPDAHERALLDDDPTSYSNFTKKLCGSYDSEVTLTAQPGTIGLYNDGAHITDVTKGSQAFGVGSFGGTVAAVVALVVEVVLGRGVRAWWFVSPIMLTK